MAGFLLWMIEFYGGLAVLVLLWPLAACWAFQGRTWGRTAAVRAHAAWLAALVAVALALDQFDGASASWKFCAVVVLIGLGMSVPTALRLRSRAAQCATLAFVAAMATMHFVDLTPRKPYERFYDAVRPGMTRADVLAAAHREFPDGGRHPFPKIAIDNAEELHFILDPTDGRWDAEWVTAYLHDGVVVSKRYEMD